MYVLAYPPRTLSAYLRGPRRRMGSYLRGARRLGDDTLPLTPPDWSNVNLDTLTPLPGSAAPIDVGQGSLPLSPASTVGPSLVNYSPAAVVPNPLNYANAATAIAAGIPPSVANAAFASQPSSFGSFFSNLTGNKLLLIGAGVAALALVAGGGRRR